MMIVNSCTSCQYFRTSPLPSGRTRCVCSFLGEKVKSDSSCDFWIAFVEALEW